MRKPGEYWWSPGVRQRLTEGNKGAPSEESLKPATGVEALSIDDRHLADEMVATVLQDRDPEALDVFLYRNVLTPGRVISPATIALLRHVRNELVKRGESEAIGATTG